MKRLLVLFLLLSPALAYANVDSLRINYGGYNSISAVHSTERAELLNVTQRIYLYPQDDVVVTQDLNNLTVSDGRLIFNKASDFSSSGWSFDFTIDSQRFISLIEVNPAFPYAKSDLPAEVLMYLDFGEKVESTTILKAKADEVVSGVSDYLTAVQLLGEFVYDYLDYTFENEYFNGTLSASAIFSLKEGVCDEYAVLFMSLARAVGIPVRYVTGYSYGNVLELGDFGPHAWVEVYVPGHGWIGMDPTYGQFGWSDASHVSVVKTWNISSNYISTSSSGYYLSEIEFSNQLPEFMTSSFGAEASGFTVESVVNESLQFSAELSLSKELLAETDYFLLTLSVTNPTNYYVPLSYNIISTTSMQFINSSKSRPILLEPLSTVESYVIMRAPVIGSHVSHPITVYLPMAGSVSTTIEVNPALTPSTSLEELALIASGERVLLEDVELVSLILNPNLTYGDSVDLLLSLRNKGNIVLNDLSVNVYGDLINDASASIQDLGINEVVNVSLPLTVTARGEGSVRVYINYGNSSVNNETALIAAINPSLSLDFVGNTSFIDTPRFIINMLNPLKANVPLLNLTITTPRDSLSKSFTPSSAPVYEVNTEFPESWLGFGENSVVFRIDYVDEYGTNFSDELTVTLTREGEWWELILEAISDFFNSILNLFK